MSRGRGDNRTAALYLAPFVDYGGTCKGTIDWFRWLDRDRYAPSLITTQPSENRRLAEVLPYAEEVWALPELMAGAAMPGFIFDFIYSRGVEVLHVMNSRLGYELLPDLACLPRPPKVVVQLHVEEADRSGYVRYVTTRYGNLVDAFSVTSEDLAERVYGYGIPRDRIHVIYTGVDADDEFSPRHATSIGGLERDRAHILYPGRLVEQKDPLLMVDVVAAARDRLPPFQVHAVGEGALEGAVRERVAEHGLDEIVLIHPPTRRLERWYAGCDLMLMTSLFEGVPYVVYEAMAMGRPVVAPSLPGTIELLDGLSGTLVEPRDDVEGYVRALAPLVEDDTRREEIGRRARERVCERFSLRRMADEHAGLYDQLLGRRPGEREVGESVVQEIGARDVPDARDNGGPPRGEDRAAQPSLRFRNRRLHDTPLVSVVVPCFNHGRFLPACLDAIRSQTYPEVEAIVVDNASTDSETLALFDELEGAPDLTVLRLTENHGPSRARNAALQRSSGRYVLPVDADNVLLPDAIEQLVGQLKVAGEEVGFIYPNLQFFGNRDDYFQAPEWDLYGLLLRNVCDVCSLFDREVFEAGERFNEDIDLGYEDWEFVLRLAARGVRGEPAYAPTLRYRKFGFNRVDAVEYAGTAFRDVLSERSGLYGFKPEIKSRWSPALSIVALEPVDAQGEAGRRLGRRLVNQSCIDVELIARFDGTWPAPREEPAVIRIPPALSDCAGRALADGWAAARGSMVAVTSGTGSVLLADPAFVEKVLRVFRTAVAGGAPIGALVLADAGDDGIFPMHVIDSEQAVAAAHTVVLPVETEKRLPDPLVVDRDDPVGSLLEAAVPAGARVQWRHVPPGHPHQAKRRGQGVKLPHRAIRDSRYGRDPTERLRRAPLLPSLPPPGIRRWGEAGGWTPPQSVLLQRHCQRGGERRFASIDYPPPGYECEHYLGFVRLHSLEGTARLIGLGEDDYAVAQDAPAAPSGSRDLGYVETVAFPLLEPLILARHLPTGQRVLVAGPFDRLMAEIEPIETLGFVEPYPARPHFSPDGRSTVGLVGLTRAVDHVARRHRCAAGSLAEGELTGELGALLETPPPDGTPLWIVDGRAVTGDHGASADPPRVVSAARWTVAPLNWRGFSRPVPKARALARRAAEATGRLAMRRGRAPTEPTGPPAGWMEREARDGTLPLWASYHPVTGDQVLTRSPTEAIDMGYRWPELLGHLRAEAPITGRLDQRGVTVPWASRFGMWVRRA